MRNLLILVLLWNLVVAPSLFAASKAEDRAYTAAVVLLETKFYNQAEQSFSTFVQDHPDSTNRVSAILHQAQARFFQEDYAGALDLLQKQLPQAGPQADEFQYWIAQTFFQKKDFRAAADAFAALGKNFPNSSHELEGCYFEAFAESKMGNWPRVIELLGAPAGRFELATRAQPNSPSTIDGALLLADALLRQNRFGEAEKVVAQLNAASLAPEANWRKLDLICRIQLASGRAENALETTTNSLSAATKTGNGRMLAETVLLRGDILQKLNRLPEAIAVYEQNFGTGSTNVPIGIRRRTFFKLVDLNLSQGETSNAVRRLENFIEQHPADPSVDLAMLTLGELRLKNVVSTSGGNVGSNPNSSNVFAEVMTNFSFVITNFPQSTHLGKAFLNRGWCFWLRGDYPAAEVDFAEAVARLAVSEVRAIARFKLADAQFKQTNYTAAVTNYQLLILNHSAVSRVTNELFEPALHQIVRAGLELEDVEIARDAMQKLWNWFPGGSLGGRTLLLVGEKFSLAGRSPAARDMFIRYLARIPDSPLSAEIQLALAQTHVLEKNWTNALAALDQWVTNFASHPLLPQGEFARALAFDKSGQITNAFNLMTNFVSRFPSNELASVAQNWVADFYWNHQDYRNAEKSYQELYQRFNPPAELGYQARLMAGRSAYDRSDYAEAAKYFKTLISDLIALPDTQTNKNSTAKLTDEAWFALGDTLFQDFLSNTNKAILAEAITAFSRITKDFSTNAMAQLAWGRIGDCYFQLGAQDLPQYTKASEYYSNVVYSIHADVATRSQAEICLGNVCLKQAEKMIGVERDRLIEQALGHYLDIVTDSKLRDGEVFDPKWTYEAGIAAARICESSERWEQAFNLYELLAKRLPPLRSAFEKKMATARAHLDTAEN